MVPESPLSKATFKSPATRTRPPPSRSSETDSFRVVQTEAASSFLVLVPPGAGAEEYGAVGQETVYTWTGDWPDIGNVSFPARPGTTSVHRAAFVSLRAFQKCSGTMIPALGSDLLASSVRVINRCNPRAFKEPCTDGRSDLDKPRSLMQSRSSWNFWMTQAAQSQVGR